MRLQRAMLDGSPDLMWIKDPSGRFLVVNAALANMAGTTPAEMLGKTDYDYFPREAADAYLADDQQILHGAETIRRIEPISDAATGEVRWLETIKRAVHEDDGSFLGIVGVARDITAQHRAEENLEREHSRIHDLVENVPGVVWEEYFDGSHRYVNDYVEVMVGYTRSEYLARFSSVLDLIPESEHELFRVTTEAMIEQNRGWTHRFRLLRKDGGIIWCESHCSIIRNGEGAPIGLRGVSMDVTTRVLAEETLRQSEERFRHLADVAPVMIWVTNASGAAEFQSRRILDFTGMSDLTGNNWLSVVHPDDFESARDLIAQAHETQQFTPFEIRIRRFDGEWREVLVNAISQTAPDGTFGGFVGTCIDLTDHRQFERHVQQNERLGALGRLAATIAHEINNVLMAIQPYSEVIRRSPPKTVLDRVADRIGEAVQRGGRITHQILRYAHAAEPMIRELEVQSWLDESAEEWETLLGSDVELHIDAEDDLCVLADAHQLQQIFINLATNAAHAMNRRGTLDVRARAESQWPGLETRPDGFVHFVIEDSGPGVSSDIAGRIFEPLFTTHSKGTGLGLAIVHDIVRKHGGAISVDSGRVGARFHVVLPAGEASASTAVDKSEEWPSAVQRVLIVEDEETVAEALQFLLELFEVEVSVVHRGAEALDAIASSSPDLVVLDVGLPDIPGPQVLEQIRERYATLPVLFATGHNVDPQTTTQHQKVGHVLKPFDASTLVCAVRGLVAD